MWLSARVILFVFFFMSSLISQPCHMKNWYKNEFPKGSRIQKEEIFFGVLKRKNETFRPSLSVENRRADIAAFIAWLFIWDTWLIMLADWEKFSQMIRRRYVSCIFIICTDSMFEIGRMYKYIRKRMVFSRKFHLLYVRLV